MGVFHRGGRDRAGVLQSQRTAVRVRDHVAGAELLGGARVGKRGGLVGNTRGIALCVVAVVLVAVTATIPALRTIHHGLAALPPAKSVDFLKVASGTDARGRPLDLTLEGRTVLVVVSGECDHCLKQLREFRALFDEGVYERHEVRLVFLSLQLGDVSSFENVVDGEHVHVVFDSGGQFFMKTFGSRGLPVVAYVETGGRIAYQRSGFRTRDLDREMIRRVFGE